MVCVLGQELEGGGRKWEGAQDGWSSNLRNHIFKQRVTGICQG